MWIIYLKGKIWLNYFYLYFIFLCLYVYVKDYINIYCKSKNVYVL